MSIRERLERLLLGYTAQERADIQRRFIDMRIDMALERIVGALDTDDDDDDIPPSDKYGYWTRTPAGGLRYHAYTPASDTRP